MVLTLKAIEQWAERLDAAAQTATPIRPLSAALPDLSLDDAYAIQATLNARQAARGRRPVGYKLGLTSAGAQRALGVDRPIHGVLFDDGAYADGGEIMLDGLVAPRVEPELAFVMRAPLASGCTASEALNAIAYAAPALEVIDNRILAVDPKTAGQRNALDIVADGCGVSGFVISARQFDPRGVDLARISVSFSAGGESETASFEGVFGNPVIALAHLAQGLAARGGSLDTGDVVLTGSPLKPAALVAGAEVLADYGDLGTIRLAVK